MFQLMVQGYRHGCMMLMRREGESVLFLGTAFIVHPAGYLLTAAHAIRPDDALVVVPFIDGDGFAPLTREDVAPIPVRVAQADDARNVALLRMDVEMPIGAPDHIVGNADATDIGTYLLSFGYPFGHLRIHHINAMHGMLSSKVLSPNGTRLLLFDFNPGMGSVGGPLVNTEDGRVVGILQGRFDPAAIRPPEPGAAAGVDSALSYAVAIDHGAALLAREGLDVI